MEGREYFSYGFGARPVLPLYILFAPNRLVRADNEVAIKVITSARLRTSVVMKTMKTGSTPRRTNERAIGTS